MEHTEQHTITMRKEAQRSLRENVISSDIAKMVEAANSRTREVNGWLVTAGEWSREESSSAESEWVYSYTLNVDFSHRSRQPEATELEAIARQISSKGATPQGGRWTLAEVDGERYQPHVSVEGETEDADFGYTPVSMPEDFESYFSHLFGLDNQVTRVRKAVELAIDSQWRERKHVVLHGEPGCGKSDVALSLKEALGADAVWSVDGTAMTSAGIIKELAEREVLPRIVIVEEAEKADVEALRVFMGMLDTRGEVRKVTARGSVQRDTKLLGIMTVNDLGKFKSLLAGALASRCPNKVHFPRPGRQVMQAILERDVQRMGGDFAWIDPALDFAEEANISDVREVQSICLCGQADLLTGEYQEVVRATTAPAE